MLALGALLSSEPAAAVQVRFASSCSGVARIEEVVLRDGIRFRKSGETAPVSWRSVCHLSLCCWSINTCFWHDVSGVSVVILSGVPQPLFQTIGLCLHRVFLESGNAIQRHAIRDLCRVV